MNLTLSIKLALDCKKYLIKPLMYKLVQGGSDVHLYSISQSLHPTKCVLMHLPDITSSGQIMKYNSHPDLMPNLPTPVKMQNKQLKRKCHNR